MSTEPEHLHQYPNGECVVVGEPQQPSSDPLQLPPQQPDPPPAVIPADVVILLRLYGWKTDESLQMFLRRLAAAQAEVERLREALKQVSALYDSPSPVRAFNMHTIACAALAL